MPFFRDVSAAQLVASMSSVVLGGVVEVMGSNLARDKIFTSSIGSVDLLYHSVYISNRIHKRSTALEWPAKVLEGLNTLNGTSLTINSDVDQDT